ncbi:hypothetical protein BC628DRAFT_771968 [Trametes gibbosa]|nr:hypothetical protein BC628DRAFT_771968 [Trametes gibbosa]
MLPCILPRPDWDSRDEAASISPQNSVSLFLVSQNQNQNQNLTRSRRADALHDRPLLAPGPFRIANRAAQGRTIPDPPWLPSVAKRVSPTLFPNNPLRPPSFGGCIFVPLHASRSSPTSASLRAQSCLPCARSRVLPTTGKSLRVVPPHATTRPPHGHSSHTRFLGPFPTHSSQRSHPPRPD